MCGRYVLFSTLEEITGPVAETLGVPPSRVGTVGGGWRPSYNIAPTHTVPVVRAVGEGAAAGGAVGEGDPTDPAAAPGIGASPVAAVGPARWGYPAPWASGGKVLFNARGETVFDKRSFAGSEPCLVVMNGWYEWFRPGGGSGGASQPYLTTEPGEGYREGDGEGDDAAPLLVVAGLCRTVAREGAGTQGAAGTDTAPAGQDGAGDGSGAGAAPATELRMTVVTTASAEPVGWLHDRMPRLLTPAEARDWLAGTPGDERLRDLAATPPHRPGLRSRPVSTAVGNVGNNDPGLLRPVTDGDTPR
ncbi:SOS response-associated peptidase [Corynebacterium bovis]|uniref:Abasic site processing protein n=3 Tax=Corynebacterium bovis TaxID=36808 RepID=A0A8I0CNQ3_9CORY|nr:SOS response-associated peptidase [Corynebacterium bovis]MBB3115680.1 putative SOS response-associated peptidase YedK [Corynebacterium bovis DSM 20582 = CIP 54.80]RRQ14632.1 hypothetical protein CXF47_02420 [Corynebacterium bovis]WJY77105.1 hypothetical protein CBOVI_02830 [Corynebacterium bovis DSM 20582 = CIP 54.80]